MPRADRRVPMQTLAGGAAIAALVACSLAGQPLDQPLGQGASGPAAEQEAVPTAPSELNEPAAQPSIFAREPASQMHGDLARLEALLEGSWRTVAPADADAGNSGDAGDRADGRQTMWLHMLPVETELLGRVIYAETHADGTPWLPVRQSILRLYRYGDRLRMRTYEFREASRPEVLANLWLAPEQFPAQYITPEELIPVMDVEFDRAQGGYLGRTPHAYPTMQDWGQDAAVEMTVELSVKADELVSTYAFYGLDGEPIEAGNQTARFERAQLPAQVQVDDDGLVIITLEEGDLSQPETTEGDILFLNYDGFRADGFKFDSTWDTGLAMRTWYPPRVILGLKRGMEPWKQGMRRKLIIPPELGFGQSEMRDVPPGTTLVFHGHLLRVDQAEPMPMEERRRRQERP